MNPSRIIPFIILSMLGALLGFLFFAPKEVYLTHDCDLNKTGSCNLENDGVKAIISVSPYPISPLKDITYELKLEGINPEKITTRILGHSMEMPEEQIFTLEKAGDNSYSATRAFPICTEKEMKWGLYLVIKGKDKWARTLFNLIVRK